MPRATPSNSEESQHNVNFKVGPFLDEKFQSVQDSILAVLELGWALLTAVVASIIDFVRGKEVPHPDLKQVAPSPEPLAQDKAA